MARVGSFVAALSAAAAVAACGSVRTELPASVPPAPPLVRTPAATAVTEPELPVTTAVAAPVTTASDFKSPGQQHPLAGGTLSVSYPRVGVRPPRGAAPTPEGQAWAVVNVRFCAAAGEPIAEPLVDPARFRVEVPGQGYVAPATEAPALAPNPLVAQQAVAAGTCKEGSIAYLVGGEGHVESVTYDTGDGLLRWAT